MRIGEKEIKLETAYLLSSLFVLRGFGFPLIKDAFDARFVLLEGFDLQSMKLIIAK